MAEALKRGRVVPEPRAPLPTAEVALASLLDVRDLSPAVWRLGRPPEPQDAIPQQPAAVIARGGSNLILPELQVGRVVALLRDGIHLLCHFRRTCHRSSVDLRAGDVLGQRP